MTEQKQEPPKVSQDAVLVVSEPMPAGTAEVRGYDFNEGTDYDQILHNYSKIGFQATSFAHAIDEANRMVCFYNIYDLVYIWKD